MSASGLHPTSRRGLAVTSAAVALVTAAVIGFAVRAILIQERREAIAVWSERLQAWAADRGDSIGAWVEEREADARLIAGFPTVREILDARLAASGTHGGPDAHEHLRDVARAVLASHKVDRIRVLDRELAAALLEPHEAPVAPAELALARRALQEDRVLFDLLPRPSGPGALAVVSAPVLSARSDRPVGVVQIVIDADAWLYPLLARFGDTLDTAEALLVQVDGDDILFVSPLRYWRAAPFTLRRSRATPGLAAVTALAGEARVGSFRDYRGVEVLAATRPLGVAALGLVVKTDLEEALSGYRSERRALLASALGLVATLSLLALFLGYRQLVHARTVRDRLASESLRRLEALTRTAPIFLAEFDAAGRAVQTSGSLPGLSEGIEPGVDLIAGAPPELREPLGAAFARALAGEPATLELDTRAPDGSARGLVANLAPDRREGARGVLLAALDVSRRAEAERRLRLLDAAIAQTDEAVVITDAEAVIEYVNEAFERVTGYRREEALGRKPSLLKSGRHDEAFYRTLWRTISAGGTWRGRMINRRKDGELFEEVVSIAPVCDSDGRIRHFVAVKRDVSQETRLQRELDQTRRLEALGRLAGGIAHDFNNALSIVLGYAERLRDGLARHDPRRADVVEILRAADGARGLSRQLLAFGRQRSGDERPLDLAAAVAELARLLRPLLGERIALELSLAEDAGWVRFDPGQLDQLVTNLVLNARDAMPRGGRLGLSTREVEIPAGSASDLPPGRYLRLRVEDDGVGMTSEILERAFEPFFTTKAEGTGLGLATVYGLVQEAGGRVTIDSAPDAGTRVDVLLPRIDPEPRTARPDPTPKPAIVSRPGPRRRILVIEDQESLRRLLEITLERLGHEVVAVADGSAADEAVASGERFDLLLTDVVLPGASGPELAASFARENPSLRVLFVSGYPDGGGVSGGSQAIAPLLAKPFSTAELEAALRAALDGPPYSLPESV